MGGRGEYDVGAPQRAAFEAVDWRDVLKRLVRFARARGASPVDALDLAQAAASLVLSGERRWDPSSTTSFERFMLGVVASLMSHAKERAARVPEVPGGVPDDAPAPISDRLPAPEREARYAAALARLRAALEGDAIALAVVDLTSEGVDKPAELAARLGAKVELVYDARDRIARHVRRIAKQADDVGSEVAQ